MNLRSNKPLRNLGVYILNDLELILLKRSEVLAFLFSRENWSLRGPVDYRISHGMIFQNGRSTKWTDEDLFDTGMTAKEPSRSNLLNGTKE